MDENVRPAGLKQYFLLFLVIVTIGFSIFLFVSKTKTVTPPKGYRGNIPNLPEYNNPPYPKNFK